MPIRVHLDRILLERRMSLTELADRVGVTIANLSILKTGKARAIRFSTLDALCRELNCQPGDIWWCSRRARRTTMAWIWRSEPRLRSSLLSALYAEAVLAGFLRHAWRDRHRGGHVGVTLALVALARFRQATAIATRPRWALS